MNNDLENEMLSPERKEEIARQNLSKIEEMNSQSQQSSSIYTVDQGNMPSPKSKPPNEFEVQRILKGEPVDQPRTSNKRKINFTDENGNVTEVDDQGSVHSFSIPKVGYYFVPEKHLPSRGDFYLPGYSIAYRAAQTKEIKHYATTDRGDYLEFSDALNYLLRYCCEIKIKNTISHLDLLEFDRIYLLFCIREITMPEGTQPFTIQHDCHCGYVNDLPITKDNINKMDWNIPIGDDPEKTLARYYDPEKRCFSIKTKNGKNDMLLYVPTIGTTSKVFNFMQKELQKKKNTDFNNIYAFKEYSKLYYVIPDHKLIDEKGSYVKKILFEQNQWSLDKIKLFIRLTDKIEEAITPSVTYTCKGCGEEVSADIMFPEGYKKVFIDDATDISDELS